MPVKKEENEHMKCHGKKKIMLGAGLFIFGLVLWYTNSWSVAFMVVGILAILKGLLSYSMK